MADLSTVLNSIKKNIKNNTEGRITGNLMQSQLIQIVNSLNDAKLDSSGPVSGLETDDKTIIGAINEINKKTGGKNNIVIGDELPEVGEPDTIYIVPVENPTSDNNFDEFIYINNKWEPFGGNIDNLTNAEIIEITTL